MAQPTKEHLQSAQRALKYASGTKDRGLLYRIGTTAQLVGYTDADWAGNPADCRSRFGYAFSLGSATVAWSRKKQLTIALSSTKVEYRGAAVATCEALWLKRLLKDCKRRCLIRRRSTATTSAASSSRTTPFSTHGPSTFRCTIC